VDREGGDLAAALAVARLGEETPRLAHVVLEGRAWRIARPVQPGIAAGTQVQSGASLARVTRRTIASRSIASASARRTRGSSKGGRATLTR
jgi:hypothetical protein